MTPKRKADELQAAGAEQHEAAEEQGRHKQVGYKQSVCMCLFCIVVSFGQL